MELEVPRTLELGNLKTHYRVSLFLQQPDLGMTVHSIPVWFTLKLPLLTLFGIINACDFNTDHGVVGRGSWVEGRGSRGRGVEGVL